MVNAGEQKLACTRWRHSILCFAAKATGRLVDEGARRTRGKFKGTLNQQKSASPSSCGQRTRRTCCSASWTQAESCHRLSVQWHLLLHEAREGFKIDGSRADAARAHKLRGAALQVLKSARRCHGQAGAWLLSVTETADLRAKRLSKMRRLNTSSTFQQIGIVLRLEQRVKQELRADRAIA